MRPTSQISFFFFFFFFHDPPTTEIYTRPYTLSLHDALPIYGFFAVLFTGRWPRGAFDYLRSEEHTSELQSHGLISYAVFCLKKKKKIKLLGLYVLIHKYKNVYNLKEIK